jgi:small subunit ribosomal protein S14
MTVSYYKKILKQLKSKPIKAKKFLKFSAPKKRSCGFNNFKCVSCGRTGAHISSYGIGLCRQCFRENATRLGFKKYH